MKHNINNMLKTFISKHVNYNKSLEIVTKPYALFSKSPKYGGPPTKLR